MNSTVALPFCPSQSRASHANNVASVSREAARTRFGLQRKYAIVAAGLLVGMSAAPVIARGPGAAQPATTAQPDESTGALLKRIDFLLADDPDLKASVRGGSFVTDLQVINVRLERAIGL